jgi:hypothetical protein
VSVPAVEPPRYSSCAYFGKPAGRLV